MTERLVITRMGHRGDGIAETAAGQLFVPHTLPGETVEVERVPGDPDRRQLLALRLASPDRIAPVCRHFANCGGCALQHWSGARYREFKRGLVVSALAKVGLNVAVADLVDAHGTGRRRAVFHARFGQRGRVELGFAAYRSHRIVCIDRCPVLVPELDRALLVAHHLAELLAAVGKPLDIHVTATQAGLDIDLRGSGALSPTVMANLATAAKRSSLARLTRHGELVAQEAAPVVVIGRSRVTLPPAAFLQPTAAGEAELARQVIGHVGASKRVADLFAGLGSFALRLAERARVTAVDCDSGALAALLAAANATSGLKPVSVVHRDLFRAPIAANDHAGFDAVVFDPPRQGAQAQARALAGSGVPLIVAVSCSPASFARDARILLEGGYSLKRVTPIDQFRFTPHVELVARFER